MAERLAASGIPLDRDANAEYAPTDDRAGVGPRVLAFAIDSALLFGVSMVFAAVAGGFILLGSDGGRSNVTEGQEWGLMVSLLATIPVWFVATLLIVTIRGATLGQYVVGLGIRDANDRPPALKRVALYLLAAHPLFFHPVLAGIWFLFGWFTVSLAENEVVFTLCLALSFAGLIGPLLNLGFILTDPERRGIHDRLAGLRVVRL